MSRFCIGNLLSAVLLACATTAAARGPIDCPLSNAPFSASTPLIDIMASTAAKAVLDKDIPGLSRTLPERFMNPSPPTFASILTPRTLADIARLPTRDFDTLDRDLRAVPVTTADRIARCVRYDIDAVTLIIPSGQPRLLLFEKMTGFRDGPSVDAAHAALVAMAARNGWALVTSEKGGVITSANLRKFDAVIWNNVSGDVLTLTQRRVLRHYIEHGGGFAAFHGSGGDPTYFWDWYADSLIGARFRGHPMGPQFQAARVRVDDPAAVIVRGLPADWTMTDEWYSFKTNPRAGGAHILATLDETTYKPVEMGLNIAMGADHPIAWTRCVGAGRSFYSAIGHRPETYAEPNTLRLLEQGILWAAGRGATHCAADREAAGPPRIRSAR